MPRPRTTKTTYGASYPRYPLGRTRYVTTDRRGNRRVTEVNGILELLGQVFLAFLAVLLAAAVLAIFVLLGVAALIGLATRNERLKRAPTAWVGFWGGVIRGWFSRHS